MLRCSLRSNAQCHNKQAEQIRPAPVGDMVMFVFSKIELRNSPTMLAITLFTFLHFKGRY